MQPFKKIIFSVGVLAGLFLLWCRLGGIVGIAEAALAAAVQTSGTSPYAQRELAAVAFGVDMPARYLILFMDEEETKKKQVNARYAIIKVRHAIPSIETQGYISFTTSSEIIQKISPKKPEMTATVTVSGAAMRTLHISQDDTLSLWRLAPKSGADLRSMYALLDAHDVGFFSTDMRLQKIFELKQWDSAVFAKK